MLLNAYIVCVWSFFFFFKQKTAYDICLGIPAEPLFRSDRKSGSAGKECFSQPQSHLSFCVLLQYLGYDATPFNQILKQNAKREMRLRLGKVTVADVLARSEERRVGKECSYGRREDQEDE